MSLKDYKLKDGDVADVTLVNVPVTLDAAGNLSIGGVSLSYDDNGVVITRIRRRLPDNWPPRPNDVWMADGITCHTLFKPFKGLRFHVSDGFKSSNPDKILASHPDLKLSFRNGKEVS